MMNDLRTQFGRTLAFALFPLLVFSIWQAWYNYKIDYNSKVKLFSESTLSATNELFSRLSTAKSILTISSQRMSATTCKPVIGTMLSVITPMENVILLNNKDDFLCAGNDFSNKEYLAKIAETMSPENDYKVKLVDSKFGASPTRKKILFAHSRYDNDIVDRVIVAVFDPVDLNTLIDQSAFGAGTQFAIFNREGEKIMGELGVQITNSVAKELSSLNATSSSEMMMGHGDGQETLIIPHKQLGLFIVAIPPKPNYFSPTYVSALITTLVPLLSWLFAFAAIWWSASRLLVIPIQSMRAQLVTSKKQGGHKNIKFSSTPPKEIDDLASTYNELNSVIQDQKTSLKNSLSEKETLLREIHHRVKNNLQVIISLLNMQERKLKDPLGLEAVQESRHRIQAIALVHKALYEGDTLRFIEMNTFIDQMTSQLSRALILDRKGINLEIENTCPPIESDRATPVALFIVEAITNSVKHGIPNGGTISIKLLKKGGNIEVSVEDHGSYQNKPKDNAASEGSGTGKRLMAGFARQLEGTFSSEASNNGYISKIICPIEV